MNKIAPVLEIGAVLSVILVLGYDPLMTPFVIIAFFTLSFVYLATGYSILNDIPFGGLLKEKHTKDRGNIQTHKDNQSTL